jgi:hypothetical protein
MKQRKLGMPMIAAAIVMVAVMAIFFSGCQSSTTTSTTTTATTAASPSQTAGTPAATDTVTITPTTPSPTPEATKAVSKPDAQPYTLSKGRRDPFVPFGGAVGSGDAGKPIVVPTAGSPTPGEAGKPIAAPTKPGIGVPGTAPEITNIPVQVTGTFVSGGRNFAILTSEGGAPGKGGAPSFVVSTGDNVGEYKVKSISHNSVVLIWSGKEYTLKIKTFGPNSNPVKQSTTKADEPTNKSLPAPEKQKTAPGGGEPPPPEGGGAPGGEGKKSK